MSCHAITTEARTAMSMDVQSRHGRGRKGQDSDQRPRNTVGGLPSDTWAGCGGLQIVGKAELDVPAIAVAYTKGGGGGGMMLGFEMTSTILTPCQTDSVRLKSIVLCSQIVVPCCSRSANQTCTACCLEVIALVRLSTVSWAVRVSSSPSNNPKRGAGFGVRRETRSGASRGRGGACV